MKILFLTSGRHVPASRFRVQQYVPHLRQAGHTCRVWPSHPAKYASYKVIGWRASIALRAWLRYWQAVRARLQRFDIVFIERELFDNDSVDMEKRFRRVAPGMIVDVDDAIFLRHRDKYRALVQMCDAVIVGNRRLLDYTAELHPHVTVIPTCVDLDRYVPRDSQPPSHRPLVLGWTGTSSNLPYLQMLQEPLRALARQHRLQLHVIADSAAPLRDMDFGALPIEFSPWSERHELEQLRQFDIGLMPLADTEWEQYKCGLKIIQYLALRIPAVASPVGVNCEIIRHGENGYLAASPAEWATCLSNLAADAELRRRLGAAGRATVAQKYSIQANLPLLMQTLNACPKRG